MESITREERLMNAAAGGGASGIKPITREEQFLAYAAGESDTKPTPITRKEMFLDKIGGGGGTATPLQEKSITITENGTTEVLPDEGYALSKVTANVGVVVGGVATGTFMLTEDSSAVEITHNLGSVPYIALWYLESDKTSIRDVTVGSGYAAFGYSIDNSNSGVVYKTGSSITSSLSLGAMATTSVTIEHYRGTTAMPSVLTRATEETATLHPMHNTPSVKFSAGNKYRWIMIAEEMS